MGDTLKKEKAVFAAGCFWGVEENFRSLSGVLQTRVGYTGGKTVDPSYEEVCGGETEHAEALEIVFDSEQLSYTSLLELFFKIHDPTQVNQQGPDVGSQYRSHIFTTREKQKKLAKDLIETLQKSVAFSRPIATKISELTKFFPAEEYHQQYLFKKNQPACTLPES